MHYCIAVITDQFPTDETLGQKLAPYDENAFYSQFEDGEEIEEEINKAQRPLFMWDYWQVGGRYGGQLKLKIDKKKRGISVGILRKRSSGRPIISIKYG